MAALRLCRVCSQLHRLDEPWPAACADHFGHRVARSDLPCPSIRADGMEPVQSMADGRVYDSRSAYYASVKAAGCEIVGNERAAFDRKPEFKPQGVGESIKRAIEQLESR